MKIENHWIVFSPSGEIAGASKHNEDRAWTDAEDNSDTKRNALGHIGYRCVKCKIEETT